MQVELRPELSTANPDEAVTVAARGDYMEESVVGKSAQAIMRGQDKDQEEFIEHLIRRGHFGPFEHPRAFFAVEGISRVAMAQITRHRHMSFDVQSQRYVDFSDKNATIPRSFTDTESERVYYGNADRVQKMDFIDRLERHWEESVRHYDEAIEEGIPKEDARFLLPQATPVNLTLSGNLRSFFHVIDMRHAGNAQWEVRELAEKMLEELREFAPISVAKYEEHAKGNSKNAP